MAEIWVSVSANLAKVKDYEAAKEFLVNLAKPGEEASPVEELERLIASQGCRFDVYDFPQAEYLSAMENLVIKDDKKSFKASFNVGSDVVEFCQNMSALLAGINAKWVKIKAVDDNEFEEIDWRSVEGTPDYYPSPKAIGQPFRPVLKDASGSFEAIAPDGNRFAYLSLAAGHLDGVQKMLDQSKGNVIAEFGYKAGVLHGDIVFLHRNGSVAIKATYVDGLLDGEAMLQFPDGQLGIRSSFRQGELHGHQVLYKPKETEPSFEATYVSGKPHGVVRFKAPDREIACIEFADGEPVNGAELHQHMGISASEAALVPHRRYMDFIEPIKFYKLLNRMNIKPM